MSAGGSPGLRGYLYQRDVSVWAALDVLVFKKVAHEITLEPAAMDDLEVEVGTDEPERVSVVCSTSKFRLVIQCKQSSRSNWSVDALIALLKHGKNREPATERLKREIDTRYLLVTNLPVTDTLRELRVGDFLGAPSPGSASAKMQRELPEVHERIAVLANVEPRMVEIHIRDLLREHCFVPDSQWKACLETLRRQALEKMTARTVVPWTRAEVEAAIRAHEGLLGSSSEAELYVAPISRKEILHALLTRHAVVIAGVSGTGKTLTVESLWNELRQNIPGLERRVVSVARDLDLRADAGPVLFDIEDPWGKYRFDPQDAVLIRSLPGALANVHPHRYYVVTSRTDVLGDANADDNLKPWIVPLEPEHYGRNERAEMYRRRVDRLPAALASLAHQHRGLVLGELATPLELQKFFVGLPMLAARSAKCDLDLVRDAVAYAHRDAIISNVRAQVAERKAERWAVVLWALFKGRREFSRAVFPVVQRRLARLSTEYDSGLEPLLNAFVAARNLRQKEDIVSIAHPRVEEALDEIVKNEPIRSEKIVAAVIEAVTKSAEALSGKELALPLAARIAAAAMRQKELELVLTDAARPLFDAWLEDRLLQGPVSDLAAILELAEIIGSPASELAELARFIEGRTIPLWGPGRKRESRADPLQDTDWVKRMRASEAARQVAGRFVRQVLPDDRRHYRPSLAEDLERIAGDLGDAFRDAATSILAYGFVSSVDVIARGALRDLEAFELVVPLAVKAVAVEANHGDWDRTALQIANGELNEDHEEHLESDGGEDGYAARELLNKYVERLRSAKGWQAVRNHHLVSDLAWHWCEALRDGEDDPSPEERVALAEACWNNDGEATCYALFVRRSWTYPLLEHLEQRCWQADSVHRRTFEYAAACLVESGPDRFDALCTRVRERKSLARVLGLLDAAVRGGDEISSKSQVRHRLGTIIRSWTEPSATLSRPLLEEEPRDACWRVESVHHAAIKELKPETERERLLAVRFASANGLDAAEHVRVLLHSGGLDESLEALERVPDPVLLREALASRFNKVQAAAVARLPLHDLDLLELAGSPGRYVRNAVVKRIAANPQAGMFPALAVLLKDAWQRNSHPDDIARPIAAEAAKCLEHFESLEPTEARQLVDIGLTAVDPVVRELALQTAARLGPRAERLRLVSTALASGRVVVRAACATALLLAHQLLSATDLDEITPERLTRIDPRVAVPLLGLLGAAGSEGQVLRTAQVLATDIERKVLLVPLGFGAAEHPARVDLVSSLLPAPHPAHAFLKDPRVQSLEPEDLHSLGTTAAVNAVVDFFKGVRRTG